MKRPGEYKHVIYQLHKPRLLDRFMSVTQGTTGLSPLAASHRAGGLAGWRSPGSRLSPPWDKIRVLTGEPGREVRMFFYFFFFESSALCALSGKPIIIMSAWLCKARNARHENVPRKAETTWRFQETEREKFWTCWKFRPQSGFFFWVV